MKKLIIIALITSLVGFWACQKENNQNDIHSFENPMEKVGIQHNEDLLFYIQNIKEKPKPGEGRAFVEKLIAKRYGQEIASKSISQLPPFSGDLDNFDVFAWLELCPIEPALKQQLAQTAAFLRDSESLGETISGIYILEANAAQLFQGEVLGLYYEHLAVAKHTAIFWEDEEKGGMDGLRQVEHLLSPDKFFRRINWWKVLVMDCVGGVFAGPAGYAGASVASVVEQIM